MTIEVTLELSDAVFNQAEQIAQDMRRDVTDVLADMLTQTIQPFPVHEQRPAMLREVEAYKRLHPQLVQRYLGEYVAIFQGQLVDHDLDPIKLLHRIQARLPDQVVLRRKVEKQPETVLQFRSPRIIYHK